MDMGLFLVDLDNVPENCKLTAIVFLLLSVWFDQNLLHVMMKLII